MIDIGGMKHSLALSLDTSNDNILILSPSHWIIMFSPAVNNTNQINVHRIIKEVTERSDDDDDERVRKMLNIVERKVLHEVLTILPFFHHCGALYSRWRIAIELNCVVDILIQTMFHSVTSVLSALALHIARLLWFLN